MASSSCNCLSHVTNSPSPCPSSSSNKKSMEQVWKDIKLASLCNCSTKYSHHSFLSSFHTLKSSMTTSPYDAKKSVQPHIYDSPDQRHKRLIKNRESAARSRARKQVYTNELENKISCLIEENSRLRRHVEELQLLLKTSANPSKMSTLCRTSTSPL